MLDVRTSDGRRAAEILRAAFAGSEANLFGNRVHLLLHGAKAHDVATTEGVKQALTRAGLSVESVEPIRPELEDVFLSMIGKQNEPSAKTHGD
jgi:hypothetical protein